MSIINSDIIAALRTVHDPEIPVNLYDLGLIYAIEPHDNGAVDITMTLTTPNCPVADQLPRQVQQAVEGVQGVTKADVKLVWQPAWSGDMMSEDAKMQLEMMGIDWSDPRPKGPQMTSLTFGKSNQPRGRDDTRR